MIAQREPSHHVPVISPLIGFFSTLTGPPHSYALAPLRQGHSQRITCGSRQPSTTSQPEIAFPPYITPQPSDGRCTCLPGHQDVGEPRGCIQREYRSCKAGATRNQEGLCLTKDQWTDHCAQEVCATPEDARGYDRGLGLCLCLGQHSSEMCGPLCPKRQSHILQLSCLEGIPQISITEDTGSQVRCPKIQAMPSRARCGEPQAGHLQPLSPS
ncbi:uncharacterized protein LOC125112106 [Phacochoerus africanus]|uniref:uncharacterized protein LOC125112106 n=1 Tax=Phacochoerus africanus TaxID=41426 RepID=UPI001FDABD88|nr:uncharacterized protein LOC125112106 [Phacochoerus africanus]